MGDTFSLTQTPNTLNLYLYPNGDYTSQHIPVGEISNYLCVNEDYDVPNDNNYVYTTSISLVTDLYTLDNHGSESGTINYVKVFNRAKASPYGQAATGVYRILISTSAVTYFSDDIDLTTTYNTYNNLWVNNPATGVAWTWADIDNLKIGIACSSPSVTGTGSEVASTFYPNAAGDLTNIQNCSEANHWYAMIPWVGYVYEYRTSFYDDLYNLDNHTTETTAINRVVTMFYAKCATSDYTAYARHKLKTGGVEYTSDPWLLTRTLTAYSKEYILNPQTGVAWTWTNIDNLQAGLGLKSVTGKYGRAEGYRVYVYYNSDASPEIRTTQCYAMVNYSPSTGTCYLRQPTGYSFNHQREIKKINFWNGTRKVYDLQRNSKTVILNGIEFNDGTNTATTRLKCVETMKDNGAEITLSGLPDSNLNTTWFIRNFTYDQDTSNTLIWNWSLELEKA